MSTKEVVMTEEWNESDDFGRKDYLVKISERNP